MKRNLSKYYLVMVFAVSAICFAGYKACTAESDTAREEPAATAPAEENTGATVEIVIAPDEMYAGDAKADTVRAEVYGALISGKDIPFIVAKAPYANGKATLNLSAPVNGRFLAPIKYYFAKDVTISDTTVRATNFSHFPAYKSGIRTGRFYESTAVLDILKDDRITFVGYWYVEGDVAINGSWSTEDGGEYDNKVDIRLKKGWNAVYCTRTISGNIASATQIITDKRPDNMRWVFVNDRSFEKTMIENMKQIRRKFKMNN